LHDWPDAECVKILKNVAGAMERKSRVILAEIIVPPTGADLETGWMDPVMMSVGGAERNKKHWEKLFEASGLRLEDLVTIDGTDHGAIQAVLA
jgi:O-methyltransferase.